MIIEQTYQVRGGDFAHAGDASSKVKKLLKQLDVDPRKIKSIVIALYEAEVNIVAHAWEGIIRILIDRDHIRMVLEDKGPGIADIEQAMVEGYSTASREVREMGFGAGMGLSNIKRNTDQMEITSRVGEGTVLTMVNYF
ncbi:MAG TPA: ATP-binding protein [Prolixibacteraceae bacterium]|jgi:anti-sigma regulatory factor (Ser/Thr protein kinase)|nr:anti-sigma regulatory factor [Bacteroidales bacterium]HNQ37350.1 ATP-binding protein [Prolixibacteraceae bacterium]HPJ78237.1 ATP-binding protein [Prolixibacteraceae bacterium]HRV90276.1 ATP-binding protein [Prolixibacteraceae bacterium]